MNVDGEPLTVCSVDPLTGWNRSGYCQHKPEDGGRHLVCATMTNDFLEYTRNRGNDLTRPSSNFPGLKPHDKWCICAARYAEAEEAGHAPPIVRSATHEYALNWPAVQKALKLSAQTQKKK